MADRVWGFIATGATFEALAATLVLFEDSDAALFGRAKERSMGLVERALYDLRSIRPTVATA